MITNDSPTLNKVLSVYKKQIGLPLLLIKIDTDVYEGVFLFNKQTHHIVFRVKKSGTKWAIEIITLNTPMRHISYGRGKIQNLLSYVKEFYNPENDEIIIDRIFFKLKYL